MVKVRMIWRRAWPPPAGKYEQTQSSKLAVDMKTAPLESKTRFTTGIGKGIYEPKHGWDPLDGINGSRSVFIKTGFCATELSLLPIIKGR